MAAPIALRDDFGGLELRKLAKQTKDAAQARRLLALAEIDDGGPANLRKGHYGTGPSALYVERSVPPPSRGSGLRKRGFVNAKRAAQYTPTPDALVEFFTASWIRASFIHVALRN